MSFFSRQAADLAERREPDRSYPSERDRLVWRIEDLKIWLESLRKENRRDRFSRSEAEAPPYDGVCRGEIARRDPAALDQPGDALLIAREMLREIEESGPASLIDALSEETEFSAMLAPNNRRMDHAREEA